MREKRTPCEAVMLLMQRMDTHAEEFRLDSGPWHNLLAHIKKRVVDNNKDAIIILDDFEAEMLWNKFRAAGKRQLLSFVMGKILGADKLE